MADHPTGARPAEPRAAATGPPAATNRAPGVLRPLPVAEPTLDQRWAESRGGLVERLRDQILADGPITFASFMAAALYDPADGYYATGTDRTTRSGDFLTAPEMDPLFGAALATHLEAGWQRLDRPHGFAWREDGAGSGALASGVLAELRRRRSPLLEALRYRPVEINEAHQDAILERLEAEGFALQLAPMGGVDAPVGVITANELLDALPVHRVTTRDAALAEVYVAWRDGWFADEPGPLSDAALASTLAASKIQLGEGQVAEVSLAAPAWIRGAAADLARGWLLLIDYGGEGGDLWGASHPDGLLRTYRGHHVGDDPFRAVGEQDMTAHVDMTAVKRAAVAAGLDLLGRTTQAEFLADLDSGELLVELGRDPSTAALRYRTARGALMRLLDPGAMGRFAVMAAGRGMSAEPPLRGFGFRLRRT